MSLRIPTQTETSNRRTVSDGYAIILRRRHIAICDYCWILFDHRKQSFSVFQADRKTGEPMEVLQ